MPVTNYNTYNGRIRSETTAGVITSYLTDALGSVTATVSQSQAVENTYRYKPYGATLAQTGSNPNPGFLWTGDTGSRPTGLAQSGQYNRLRHYSETVGGWTTTDPLWPPQLAYTYVGGRVVTTIDPSGLQSQPVSDFNACVLLEMGKPGGSLASACSFCSNWLGAPPQGLALWRRRLWPIRPRRLWPVRWRSR